MPSPAASVVQKLWQYCNILRDDGLSYPDYVEQLTYLLFLKMADEQGDSLIAPEFSWRSFADRGALALHKHYSDVLSALGRSEGTLGLVFRNAKNKVKDPAKLRLLIVDLIGQTAWTELSTDVKGDAYEGLLEKNAQDTKSGAGQYFTPRPLIDAIVACISPQPGELICDPACGTGGFLLAAHDYVLKRNPRLTPGERRHLATRAIHGIELVEEVARLATMNLLLHDIGATSNGNVVPIACEDSLNNPAPFKCDVVLTNPPFGVKGSVTFTQGKRRVPDELTVAREDFIVETSNKQLNFVQHVMSMLKSAGRAAVIVPDNVLFESGAAATIRRRLLESWNFHTVLRLPTGIFYAHGVKANVVFFDAPGKRVEAKRRNVWFYDLRRGSRFSFKTNRLQRKDLDEFVMCYGSRRNSTKGLRLESHKRWRAFPVDGILATKDCNLDIAWGDGAMVLPGGSGNRLDEIASLIADDLRKALAQVLEITK